MSGFRQNGKDIVFVSGFRDGPSVDRAAKWLAQRPEAHWPRPLAGELVRLFDLNPKQAEHAIREARLILARAL